MTRVICRCRLPLGPPDARLWLPSQHPEPCPELVQAVALWGQDPTVLRWQREGGGWRSQGAAVIYTDHRPWSRVGRCWSGSEHLVCDVTELFHPPAPIASLLVTAEDPPGNGGRPSGTDASYQDLVVQFVGTGRAGVQQVLDTHVDDGTGHCTICPSRAQATRESFPCRLREVAEATARLGPHDPQ